MLVTCIPSIFSIDAMAWYGRCGKFGEDSNFRARYSFLGFLNILLHHPVSFVPHLDIDWNFLKLAVDVSASDVESNCIFRLLVQSAVYQREMSAQFRVRVDDRINAPLDEWNCPCFER